MSEINLDPLDHEVHLSKQFNLITPDVVKTDTITPDPTFATIKTETPGAVENQPSSWPKRWLCNLGIGVFTALVYQYEWLEAGWVYLFGKSATSSELRTVLADLIENDDTALTHAVLQTYIENKEELDADDAVIEDILKMNNIAPYLHELLKGANVRLYGDNGAFFEKWANLSTAYTRWTSHDAKLGKSRGLTGAFINELHFWVDRKTGDTCFQVEKHPMTGPLGGFKNALLHMVDYFRYIRDDLQQSTYGTSPHTDRRPIVIDASMP